jgi:hypothetical protein
MHRVTFVGGEPLLCPHYLDLAREAKRRGAEVVLATNGAKLVGAYGDDVLAAADVVNLSLDGSDGRIMAEIGRGNARYFDWCVELWKRLATRPGLRLGSEYDGDESQCRRRHAGSRAQARPERWKVFQGFAGRGSKRGIGGFASRFGCGVRGVRRAPRGAAVEGVDVRFEDHDAIEGTYLRLDPLGAST